MGVIDLLKKLAHYLGNKLSPKSLTGRMKILLALASLLVMKLLLKLRSPAPNITTIPISQLLSPLNKQVIEQVKIFPGQVLALDSFQNITRSIYSGLSAQFLYDQLKNTAANIEYVGQSLGNSSLDYIIFILSLCSSILIYYLFKKDDYVKRPSKPEQKVKFNDIVGLDPAKFALKEVLDYMMNSDKYKERGARMRRGVLLYGPPGTGKTTLAKACANQAGIPFYSCNAAQFCQIYVGMGPKKVRQLFAKARSNAPAVIFIDELDALGSRSSDNGFMMQNANSEKNSTINQILSELDGFNTTDRLLVIAATNRLEMVDRSLVRAGRFDLKIQVKMPDLEARIQIFHRYVDKTKNTLSETFIRQLLQRAGLCTGADIEALVNEAIYLSMRRNSSNVQEEDIVNAIKQQTH